MTLTCCNPQDSYKYGIYENESAGETYGGAIKCGKITKKKLLCVCVCVEGYEGRTESHEQQFFVK